MTDDLMDLAVSLGFKDLGHRGPQGVRPRVAADSEGRSGGAAIAPGAVPFTNPPPPPPQPFPPNPFPRP